RTYVVALQHGQPPFLRSAQGDHPRWGRRLCGRRQREPPRFPTNGRPAPHNDGRHITSTSTVPPSRRNVSSCSAAQRGALDAKVIRRTLFRLKPSVKTNRRVRRYFPVTGCRTIGPSP